MKIRRSTNKVFKELRSMTEVPEAQIEGIILVIGMIEHLYQTGGHFMNALLPIGGDGYGMPIALGPLPSKEHLYQLLNDLGREPTIDAVIVAVEATMWKGKGMEGINAYSTPEELIAAKGAASEVDVVTMMFSNSDGAQLFAMLEITAKGPLSWKLHARNEDLGGALFQEFTDGVAQRQKPEAKTGQGVKVGGRKVGWSRQKGPEDDQHKEF